MDKLKLAEFLENKLAFFKEHEKDIPSYDRIVRWLVEFEDQEIA